MLKAAVWVDGRALTLYEPVHAAAGISRSRAERVFSQARSANVADGFPPIIVTGAGFHGPWFRQVRSLGWAYVGRLRNRLRLGLPGNNEWCLVKALRGQVKTKLVSLGVAAYAKRMQIEETFRAMKDRR